MLCAIYCAARVVTPECGTLGWCICEVISVSPQVPARRSAKGINEMNGMRMSLLTISTAAFAVLSSVAAFASPVAMATNMKGKPEYRAVGAGGWKPLGVLTRLSPGDNVKCGPGEEAVVMMFVDGVRFRVASNSTGTVAASGVSGAQKMAGMGGATIRVA